MKIVEKLKRIDTKQVYIGEVFNPQAYALDDNGEITGDTKAISMKKFDAVRKTEDGYYISLIDGTKYSDGSFKQIKEFYGKEDLMFLWHVETFYEATGKKGKISKKALKKELEAIQDEKLNGVEV